LISEERCKEVRKILTKLDDRDRKLLRAVFLVELGSSEVCRRFQVEPGYLRVLIFRAKARFKQAYLKGPQAPETHRSCNSLYLWGLRLMDHETAIKMQSAERYVLDEFSPEERTDFEEHYFGCTACADDVSAVSILAANAKAVIAEDEAQQAAALRSPGRATRRFSWGLVASAALNLVLLAGIGLQGLRLSPRKALPTPMEAQFYQSFGVPAASRGQMRTLLVPGGSRFFGARFDLMAGEYFDSYEYRILEAAGTPKSGQSVKAPAFNGTELQLAIPVSSLSPGEYIFVLLGRQQEKLVEISRAHLSIQR
jgi:hypothetical protein